MEYVQGVGNLYLENTAVTMGKFDGLHRGHRLLVENVLAQKALGRRAVLAAIDVNREWILSRQERVELLERLGFDLVVEIPFTEEFRSMQAQDFVKEILIGHLGARYLTVGESFHFGKGRAGDTRMLYDLGKSYGYELTVAPSVMDGPVKISSTTIRRELLGGNMERVNALMGAPYFASGRIVHGQGLGGKKLLPTINIIPPEEKLLPPFGVYFTRTHFEEGEERQTYLGITDVGKKPTVHGDRVCIETFLFDCQEDLYDRRCRIEFFHHSRPEYTFSSLEELRTRLSLDEQEGRYYWARVQRGEKVY